MSEECGFFDVACRAKEGAADVVGGLANSSLGQLANNAAEGAAETFAAMATFWVHVPTPTIKNTSGGAAKAGFTEGGGDIATVLGYLQWVGLVVAILALFWLGALIAVKSRRGEGLAAVGKLGLVLCAVVVLSGAGAIGAAIVDPLEITAAGTVGFLQGSTWMWTGALLIAGLIIGAIRMIWEQRVDPAKDLVKGILTLVVVTGAGATVTGILVSAADDFSSWILWNSVDCGSPGTDGACLADNFMALMPMTTNGLSVILMLLFGLFAICATLLQVALMVIRYAMLIMLTGLLPVTAAFSSTETGKQWFKRHIAWLVAFILYKPAAAIIYATAFQLMGQDAFTFDSSGIVSVVAGLGLLLLAVVALPAMMRFVMPMMSNMSGAGGSAGAGMALAAAIPSGAMAAGRLRSGSGSGGGSGSSGPSGASGLSGSNSSSSQSATGVQGAGKGAPSLAGGTAGGSAGGAAAAGGSAGGAAAAGGSAGGAAAAGGPWGAAAGAALDTAKKGYDVAKGTAINVATDAAGEGDGPSGNGN